MKLEKMKVGYVYTAVAHMAPFPKARARVTKRGTFMPSRYQEARKELQTICWDIPDFSDYLVAIDVLLYRPMPKSWSDKKREAMLGKWCSPGPDADNAVGGVMDALFKDDKCVVDQRGRKYWGISPEIVIRIEVVSDDPMPF